MKYLQYNFGTKISLFFTVNLLWLHFLFVQKGHLSHSTLPFVSSINSTKNHTQKCGFLPDQGLNSLAQWCSFDVLLHTLQAHFFKMCLNALRLFSALASLGSLLRKASHKSLQATFVVEPRVLVPILSQKNRIPFRMRFLAQEGTRTLMPRSTRT